MALLAFLLWACGSRAAETLRQRIRRERRESHWAYKGAHWVAISLFNAAILSGLLVALSEPPSGAVEIFGWIMMFMVPICLVLFWGHFGPARTPHWFRISEKEMEDRLFAHALLEFHGDEIIAKEFIKTCREAGLIQRLYWGESLHHARHHDKNLRRRLKAFRLFVEGRQDEMDSAESDL